MSENIIYVIQKLYQKDISTVKIGSTQNYETRFSHYVTPERDFNNNSHIIWFFYITNDLYNCYQLDESIQYSSKKYNKPYVYYDGSGGDEHYYFDTVHELSDYFDCLRVTYKCEKIDVDILREQIKKSNKNNQKKEINDSLKKLLDDKFSNKKQNNICITPQPIEHQKEMLMKLEKIYHSKDIFKLIWSCGLGKTLFSIFVVDKFCCNKIIIGVPSAYLQNQFCNEIIKIFQNKKNILLIGSGVNSTTDKKTINEHYNKKNGHPIFVITTYNSCHLLTKDYVFDLKIGDEAHHLVGIENSETKNYKLFHNIKSKKTLFMTATEKTIGTKNNKEIYSMDDGEKFGEYLDIKTPKWAIENKKITDYNVLILSNTEKEVDDIIKNLNIKVDNKDLFLSAFMSLKSIHKYDNLTHTLICCNTTKSSDIISDYVNILLDKNIFDIDKEQFYNNSLHTNKKINIDPNDENSEITKFKNSKCGIICSVYIFGEGFDLPKLNGVVFAENMISDIRIVQTALRPNRIEEGNPNKIAYILIPYMESNDLEYDNEAFNRVRMIITKLRNVDDTIEQKINFKKIVELNKNDINKNPKNFSDYDFEDEHQDLHKIKLRLIYSHALGSKNTEEQDEYNYVKQLNKELYIDSKEMYSSDEIKNTHKHYIDNPDNYFKLKGVWDNWYDFLGVDTNKYMQTKDEWIYICKKNNISSSEDYKLLSEQYDGLPKNPGDFYKGFTNIKNELGLNKRR
jgi:superfamily II DNA or RNA helicase